MRGRLEQVFRYVSVNATADREHEAVLELLLLVMLIDGRVASAEIDEIRSISDAQGMESDTFSIDQHLGEASAKVRSALAEPDGVDRLLDDISSRVTSSVLRSSLVAAARDVAGADGHVVPDEHDLLDRINSRFG